MGFQSPSCLKETVTRRFLPWSCTYRMMFPRTPYSGTMQGSAWFWPWSDLRNIFQSADGTLRQGWLLRKARGGAESPKDRRKSRSWFFISSTWEKPLTSAQAANANTSLTGGVMLCVFCLRLSTVGFVSSANDLCAQLQRSAQSRPLRDKAENRGGGSQIQARTSETIPEVGPASWMRLFSMCSSCGPCSCVCKVALNPLHRCFLLLLRTVCSP